MKTAISQTLSAAFSIAAIALVLTTSLGAQTETVLHSFTGGSDGIDPDGLAFDTKGNLYGFTWSGGEFGWGTVFLLTPTSGGWTETVVYSFKGASDGEFPQGNPVIDGFGNIYGTTAAGGLEGYCFNNSCGTVFRLSPTSSGWQHEVLYKFTGLADGGGPNPGLASDAAGNLYGATLFGGDSKCYGGCGVVWEVSQVTEGNWLETVLHTFADGADGAFPNGSVVLDRAGNIYATANGGGFYNFGAVFELSRGAVGWKPTKFYEFTGKADGNAPVANLVLDGVGNVFGVTASGGPHTLGTVYELSPSGVGSWKVTTLFSFDSAQGYAPTSVALSPGDNLFGTTEFGGDSGCYGYVAGCGVVYELSPQSSGSKESLRYAFAGSGGAFPFSNVVFDPEGNFYGTTSEGGPYGYGVVFQIMP